jgi:uncharacterized damage-inducible protein DinB
MSEIDNILDQLQREFDGDPWHGSSLKQILKDITAHEAAQRPLPGGHTIWEIVLHMAGWKGEVTRRLHGHLAGEPEAGDWPVPGESSDDGWHHAKENLHRAHTELIAALKGIAPSRLHEPVKDTRNRPLGTGMTIYQTIYGVIQHDVYHSGQIAMLKKALKPQGS